jgi:hypothetical protein
MKPKQVSGKTIDGADGGKSPAIGTAEPTIAEGRGAARFFPFRLIALESRGTQIDSGSLIAPGMHKALRNGQTFVCVLRIPCSHPFSDSRTGPSYAST